jgi:hypothetical protein
VFQGPKEGSCFAADRFFAIKYNPKRSEGVEIFCKTHRARTCSSVKTRNIPSLLQTDLTPRRFLAQPDVEEIIKGKD